MSREEKIQYLMELFDQLSQDDQDEFLLALQSFKAGQNIDDAFQIIIGKRIQ